MTKQFQKQKKTATAIAAAAATTKNELSPSNENMKISKQVSTFAGTLNGTHWIFYMMPPPHTHTHTYSMYFKSRQDLIVCMRAYVWEWVIEMMTFIGIQLLFICQFCLHSMHRFYILRVHLHTFIFDLKQGKKNQYFSWALTC